MSLQRIVWLGSYPKSGNTWTRVFLANAFMPPGEAPDINHLRRFTTADVRQDFFDRAAGRPFRAETVDAWLAMRPKALRLIAASKPGHHFVKTHSKIGRLRGVDLIDPAVTAAGVYILRNPFDVAPSYARHMGIDIDRAIDMMADPMALTTSDSGICEIIGRWDEHVESWTEAEGLPLHVMRYEDMSADPERAFRGLLTFLGAKVPDGVLRRAIRAASFDTLKKQEAAKGFIERPPQMEAFFAKGQAGAWRQDLTPAQVGRIRAAFLPALERWYPDIAAETEGA